MSPLFIINRQSTRVKKKGARLEALAAQARAKVIQTDQPEIFKHQFGNMLNQGISHIFIEGGDGTVQTVMTEYFKWLPEKTLPAKFSIIGGGTTNQIAKNIGVKRSAPSYLKALITGTSGEAHTLPLLSISIDGNPAHIGCLFSSGAIPMATDYYMDEVRGSGKTGPSAVYATIVAALGKGASKETAFMAPTPVKLLVSTDKDETLINEEHLGTIVTTLPGFILGIDPFWGKGEAALRLTYVRGDKTGLIRLVLNAALRRFDILDKTDGIESWTADYIRYDYNGPIVLDGERLGKAKENIEIRPTQTVTFIA